jgi:hypothetical protein
MGGEPNIEIKASVELKAEIPADVQRDTLDFAKRILGPIGELSDLLSDRIRFARFRQTVWMLGRAKEICAEAGVEPKQVPLSVLVPLLDKSSLEDDGPQSLKENWAALLANAAMNPQKKYAKYCALLEELDFAEAELLARLKAEVSRHELFKPDRLGDFVNTEQGAKWGPGGVASIDELEQSGRIAYHWHGDDIPNTNEFSFADLEDIVPLLHLHNLGLIKVSTGSFRGQDVVPGEHDELIFYVYGDITPLGFDFVSACERPEV